MTTLNYSAAAENAVHAAIAHFPKAKIAAEDIGITIARLDRAHQSVVQGSFQGAVAFYPASVVKLFYLVRLANLLHDGTLRMTPELERASHDMIVDSINDATGLVLDTITGTTSGPELPPAEMAVWAEKRNSVNRWYESLGFKGVNACQKTWNEGPYGRERAFYGVKYENRNRLTPDVCVKLMGEIALGKAVPYGGEPDTHWKDWIDATLNRPLPSDGNANEQAVKFSGSVLPKGTQLWSKAGWTDSVRHDVAWFKLPSGEEWIWAIFTHNHSDEEGLVPYLAGELLKAIQSQ